MDSSPLRTLSLFSGIGGLDLGLQRAFRRIGARHESVAYVEVEAFAAAVLVACMEAGELAPAPVWTDVATFDGRPFRGLVDVVAGGFPCQDISCAGKGAGIEGERSGLWSEFARIVGEVRPRYVFIENVRALVSRGLDVVLCDLAALGFDAEWVNLRASEIGAPHRRERIFILARSVDDPSGARSERRRPETDSEARHQARLRELGGRRDRMGDTERARRPATGERCDEHAGREPQAGRGGMAHPVYDRLEGGERGIVADPREGRQHAAALGSGLPVWPPGPSDAEGWQRVLEQRPDLAPALEPQNGQLAHGPAPGVVRAMTDRVDKLRALGNAVVPAQAEAAFLELYRRVTTAAQPGDTETT